MVDTIEAPAEAPDPAVKMREIADDGRDRRSAASGPSAR